MPPYSTEEIIAKVSSIEGKRFVRFSGEFKGVQTKCEMSCCKCGNLWSATAVNLYSSGTNCPRCARYDSTIGIDEVIRRFSSIKGFEFVGVKGDYKGKKTIGVMRCAKHGDWDVSADFAVRGCGCRRCAEEASSERYRMKLDELMPRMVDGRNISFVEFIGGKYVNQKTKVKMVCNDCGNEWSSSAASFLYTKSGCPSCAKYGFRGGKTGYLYALKSSCGRYCKIGIANNLEHRIGNLSKRTPFEFSVYGVRRYSNGMDAKNMEFYLHKKHKSANMSGFDGATEWMIYDECLSAELNKIMAV